MRKILSFLCVALVSVMAFAQHTVVQGVPRNQQTKVANNEPAVVMPNIDFGEIQYWVGYGSKRAAFVVKWDDGKGNQKNLVWGYRFNSSNTTGEQMLRAIAAADSRFYVLLYGETEYGAAIGGMGYDLNGNGNIQLVKNNISYSLTNGVYDTDAYDFDAWTSNDPLDHWNAGWMNGYWSYWTTNSTSTAYEYSQVGATSRHLVDGSIDGWSFMSDMVNWYSNDMTGEAEYVLPPASTSEIRKTARTTVTTGNKYIVHSMEEFEEYVYDTADGDIIEFDESLRGQVIKNTLVEGPWIESAITIIGNGVIIEGGAEPFFLYPRNADKTQATICRQVKDVVFRNLTLYAQDININIENCIFEDTDDHDGPAICIDNGQHFNLNCEVSNCRFSNWNNTSSFNTGILRLFQVYGSSNVTHTNISSCTFANNNGEPIKSVNHGEVKVINSVFEGNTQTGATIDFNTTNHNVKSLGYNVIEGSVSDVSVLTATDIINTELDPILALQDGEYRVLPTGAAYNHLPANTVIEGVTFPKTDITGATIDYTQPTHSGACQQVYKPSCASDIAFSETVDGAFTLNPRHILGLVPEVTTTTEYDRIDYTLEGAGESKDDVIASLYTVNINGGKMPELIAHHKGTCKLIATVVPKDAAAYASFSKEFTVNVVDYEPANVDYSHGGTFILNEEWFGHTSGSINYITEDGEYIYRAYGRENDYKAFGATSQYGTIWNDKLIVMSKQNIDKGDPLGGGGRVVIADANTLKYLGSIQDLVIDGESHSADGRAVAGATPNKIYVGSTQGIYVVDITDPTNPTIAGKVEGIAAGVNAYNGQVGDMITTAKYVFAIQQKTGAHVIDVETDKLVKTIDLTGIEGITQSMDGTVWLAATIDKQTHLIPVNPATLEEGEHVVVPTEIGKITCEWSAWKTTQFFSNMANNELWFAPQSGWKNSGKFYRYVIGEDDINTIQPVFELGTRAGISTGKNQMIYGASRYDHRSGRLIVMTTEDGYSGHYRHNWTYRIDNTGEIKDYIALEPYYWFQSMPIFPDESKPELSGLEEIVISDKTSVTIDLSDYVLDADNVKANIRINATDAENEMAGFAVEGTTLTITPKSTGETNYLFNAESNGCTSEIDLAVRVDITTGINETACARKIYANDNHLFVYGYEGSDFVLVDAAGKVMDRFTADSDVYVTSFNFNPGVYVLKGNGVSFKLMLK